MKPELEKGLKASGQKAVAQMLNEDEQPKPKDAAKPDGVKPDSAKPDSGKTPSEKSTPKNRQTAVSERCGWGLILDGRYARWARASRRWCDATGFCAPQRTSLKR